MRLPSCTSVLSLLLLFSCEAFGQLKTRGQLDSLMGVYREVEITNPDSAIELYLALGEDDYYKKNFPYFVSVSQEIAGLMLTDKGQLKESLACFDTSYVYALACDDRLGASSVMNNKGIAYHLLGYYDLAIEHYIKSEQEAEIIGDTSYMVLAITNTASMYYHLGQYDKAISHQRRAIGLAQQSTSEDIDRPRLFVDMSLGFYNAGMQDSAKYYNDLSKASVQEQDNITRATILLMDYRLLKDTDRAKATIALQQATEMIEKHQGISAGALYGKVLEAYHLNAENALHYGNYQQAEHYYKECLKMASEANSVKDIRNAYSGLRSMAEKMHNYKDALYYSKMAESYTDTVFNVERERLMQQHAFIYDTEKKERELEMKELALEQHRQKIKQKNLLIAVAFSIIALLVAAAYFIYRNIGLKRQLEKHQVLLNERKRISVELHDDVGAKLSAAGMFLDTVKNGMAQNTNPDLVESARKLVNASVDQLREVVQDLQNTTLEQQGYVHALEELIIILAPSGKTKIAFSHSGANQRMDKDVEHQLFRITQELINNTLKYAQAQNITIRLAQSKDTAELTYTDDGTGFNPETATNGNGLKNIRSRIHALNGHLELTSAQGKGTQVYVRMKL